MCSGLFIPVSLQINMKNRESYLYRTATTACPCFLPDLGGLSRSWSYKTHPEMQKYEFSCFIQTIVN